jgi:integrase/recombinase XerD
MRRAGVGGTPHQLRHSFGTNALRVAGDVRVAQELLRHASLATTQLYTAVDDTARRAAIHALPTPPGAVQHPQRRRRWS